jgi:hypothetical protein
MQLTCSVVEYTVHKYVNILRPLEFDTLQCVMLFQNSGRMYCLYLQSIFNYRYLLVETFNVLFLIREITFLPFFQEFLGNDLKEHVDGNKREMNKGFGREHRYVEESQMGRVFQQSPTVRFYKKQNAHAVVFLCRRGNEIFPQSKMRTCS